MKAIFKIVLTLYCGFLSVQVFSLPRQTIAFEDSQLDDQYSLPLKVANAEQDGDDLLLLMLPAIIAAGQNTEPPDPMPSLSGKLFFNLTGTLKSYDIVTGEVSGVFSEPGRVFYISDNAGEFAYNSATNVLTNTDQIRIYSIHSGQRETTIEKPRFINGPVKISSDGARIAAEWHLLGQCCDRVSIFNRAGTLLAFAQPYVSWAWMPDGRLVLSGNGGIWISDLALTTITRIRSFTSGQEPLWLSINQQGTAMAFELNAHIWTMSVDGTNLTQLTTSSSQEYSPTWSADGKLIAFNFGLPPNFPGNDCDGIYRVPSNGIMLTVDLDLATSDAVPFLDDTGSRICSTHHTIWTP